MKHDLSNVEGAGERGLAAALMAVAWRDLRSKNAEHRHSSERFWSGAYRSSLWIWCAALDLDEGVVRQRIADEIDRSVQPDR